MTNKEIEDIEKKLKDIQNKPFNEQLNSMNKLQKDIGLNLPHTLGNTTQKKIFYMVTGIRTFLESKMMLNACVFAEQSCKLVKQACGSAKWSCRWAAIAAIVACISIVIMLCSK